MATIKVKKVCDPKKDLQNTLIFYQTLKYHVLDSHFHQCMKKHVGEGICCHASHQYGRYHARAEYKESVLCRLQSMQARECNLDLKLRADITRSRKEEFKDYCSPKIDLKTPKP